ncbi:MAG TPA: 5-formyltetrahydrofolate cyclo-ligase [Caldimonas sp.]|nr:5-formyltetrahydrofolate cyclo-ligase [Caldimonas sp.]HEX2540369.1 5-formyltetrahydrofolate cyclo-ligase [Caldimonas sp.]
MNTVPAPPGLPLPDRPALRARLLEARHAFAASATFAAAAEALGSHLRDTLARLEPECLGLYWPVRSEFNAAVAIGADPAFDKTRRALPFARREPPRLEFRRWDGAAPTQVDECGIGSSDGAVVQPDVVVVPCVGFTREGHRLGYGGGYYDRWLAANAHVVAVGVAWSFAEIDVATFAPQPHDVTLACVVTELGVR